MGSISQENFKAPTFFLSHALMLNRYAIARFTLGLLLLCPAAMSLIAEAPAHAQIDCTPEPDCAQKVHRRILQDYPQQLAAAKKSGDNAKLIAVMQEAGEAHQYFGEFPAAIAIYQKALLLARQTKERRGEAQVLSNLTLTYNKQTPPNGGALFLEQELQRVSGDRASQKIALATLGEISINLENYQKVLESYNRYLPMVRQDGDKQAEATALWNSSIALSYSGNLNGAIVSMEKAIVLQDPQRTPELTNIYMSQLAELYLRKGDVDQAGRTYDRVVKNSLRNRNLFWMTQGYEGLATAYAAIKDLRSAQDVLAGSLELADSVEGLRNSLRRDALDKLSLTYAWQGDYAKAIATQQKIAQITGDPSAISQNQLGAFYLRSGKFAEAETALRQTIALYARSRSTLDQNSSNLSPNSFDVDLRSNYDFANTAYRNLEEALIGQNKISEALEISEEGRAKAFLSLLASRLGVTRNTQPNLPSITLNRIKQVAKAQNSTLVEYSVIYPDLFGMRSSLNKFRYGTEPFKPSALHIWVIKPTGEVTFRSVDLSKKLAGESLEQVIRASRESLGVRGRGANAPVRNATTQRLQQLYDLLIQPIADLLPTDPLQQVTIIPQDELFLVPFAAIKTPNNQYLIERHTLLTAPSIQILELTHSLKAQPIKPAAKSNATALVVGNPKMPSLRFELEQPPQPLEPLSGAEEEAKAIAQLLKTLPLLGNQATETKVKAELGKARWVHLATHGILENLQGLQSALAFAPSGSDDGFLTAKEILKLRLNAELVVLSACDTGRGNISGDGVLGISRSFLSAGTPSLVISLWAIPDASTADLMTHFYKNLQTQPNKAQALRQAMLTTLKQYPNPQDWAAFTLMGEAL
jgi:CHAT domain-containing protein